VVIRATDRVSAVLAHDERLIDVFVALSPAFERLRNPMLRRVMARLVSVEQAAQIARIDASLLLARLNAATGAAAPAANQTEPPHTEPEEDMATDSILMPAALDGLDEAQILDLDVRDDLRQGREPFGRIMGVRRALAPGQVLRLRAIFEPVPLYQVMAKQGLARWTERLAADDWRIWFYPDAAAAATEAAAEPTTCGGCGPKRAPAPAASEDDVVVLDVRGLEPPEPMVRTLAALDALPPGGTLVQLNTRVPQHLLPRLDEAGYRYEVHDRQPNLVRVVIRRAPAAGAA
jgi:uncharacterized protein (DUF2249 family)